MNATELGRRLQTTLPGREMLWFLITGAVNTLVNFTSFMVVIRLGGNYLVGSFIGWMLAIAIGYVMNRHLTFRSGNRVHGELARHIAANVALLGVSWTGLIFFISYIGLPPALGFCCSAVTVFLTNYLAAKFWVFSRRLHSSYTP